MALWDDIILPEDKQAFGKYVANAKIGFGKRPLILVVDMTYSFVDERYSTGCGKAAHKCVKSIKELLGVARPLSVPIIYTRSSERPTQAEKGRWKSTVSVHADDKYDHSDERSIVEELIPTKDDPVIEKDRPSAFFGTNLPSILNYYSPDTLIVTGLSTSGCIRATTVDAFSYNYRVIIPIECVGDRCITSHKVALFDIQMKYGDVVGLKDVITYLKAT